MSTNEDPLRDPHAPGCPVRNVMAKDEPANPVLNNQLDAIDRADVLRETARERAIYGDSRRMEEQMRNALLVLLSVLLWAGGATAQVVRLCNYSSSPFDGWKRATVDVMPAHESGQVGDVRYVLGRSVGRDVRVVDLQVRLAPGQALTVDLGAAVAWPFVRGSLPADPLGFFGAPSVADVPLQLASIRPDGAGYTSEWWARTGRMLCTRVWTTWYPDRPAIVTGDVVVVASNPAVPDLVATVPSGLTLRFGDAVVIVPGAGVGAPLVAAGTTLADGQGKAFPISLVWVRHLQRASDWSSVGVVADLAVGAVGIRQLWQEGNPKFPTGWSARSWANARFAASVQVLHTWDLPVCGPAVRSADTGAQEDQLWWPGGEALQPDGVGAEWVRLLSALKLHAERPANHLEVDGSPLDPDRHPSLMMWDCRPFFAVSQDRLGKARELDVTETHGRWGADTQHWLTRSLGSASRLTGRPAAGWLMERLAVAYLLQRTSVPSWSTSATFSAREWGYEGLWVVQCDRDLPDRALAARVVARWRERVRAILLPQMEGKDLLMPMRDDRLGPGVWAIAWQEALGAYGIDLACQVLGPVEGRAVALRVARRVLADGWQMRGQWLSRAQFPVSGPLPDPDGSFNLFGMPCAAAVVLRHEPTNERAWAIWSQLQRDSGGGATWLAPGVR